MRKSCLSLCLACLLLLAGLPVLAEGGDRLPPVTVLHSIYTTQQKMLCTIYVPFSLTNQGDAPIAIRKVTVTLMDQQGAPLHQQDELSITPSLLQPGETAYGQCSIQRCGLTGEDVGQTTLIPSVQVYQGEAPQAPAYVAVDMASGTSLVGQPYLSLALHLHAASEAQLSQGAMVALAALDENGVPREVLTMPLTAQQLAQAYAAPQETPEDAPEEASPPSASNPDATASEASPEEVENLQRPQQSHPMATIPGAFTLHSTQLIHTEEAISSFTGDRYLVAGGYDVALGPLWQLPLPSLLPEAPQAGSEQPVQITQQALFMVETPAATLLQVPFHLTNPSSQPLSVPVCTARVLTPDGKLLLEQQVQVFPSVLPAKGDAFGKLSISLTGLSKSSIGEVQLLPQVQPGSPSPQLTLPLTLEKHEDAISYGALRSLFSCRNTTGQPLWDGMVVVAYWDKAGGLQDVVLQPYDGISTSESPIAIGPADELELLVLMWHIDYETFLDFYEKKGVGAVQGFVCSTTGGNRFSDIEIETDEEDTAFPGQETTAPPTDELEELAVTE